MKKNHLHNISITELEKRIRKHKFIDNIIMFFTICLIIGFICQFCFEPFS